MKRLQAHAPAQNSLTAAVLWMITTVLVAQETAPGPHARLLVLNSREASRLIVDQVRPEYPPLAKVNSIQGPVRIQLLVAGGGRVASGSDDGTVKVWATAGGGQALTLTGHHQPVTGVAFSPGGRLLASSSRDGTVRTYRCDLCGGLDELLALSGRELARTRRTLTAAERRRYLHD